MKKLCLILVVVLCLGLMVGCGSNAGAPAKTTEPSETSETNTVSNDTSDMEPKPVQKSEWNTNDMNVGNNGNLPYALNLAANSLDSIKQEAAGETPSMVFKAPFKYYGKAIKLTGLVVITQEYAPNSDVANNINSGKECGEIVFMCEDGTYVDYMQLGDTGNIAVGDTVTVYGYTPGIVNVENKMGGTTDELLIVGKFFSKQ